MANIYQLPHVYLANPLSTGVHMSSTLLLSN